MCTCLSETNVNSDFQKSILPSQKSKGKCKKGKKKKKKRAEHLSSPEEHEV